MSLTCEKTGGQFLGDKGKCSEGGSMEQGSGWLLWELPESLPLQTRSWEMGP